MSRPSVSCSGRYSLTFLMISASWPRASFSQKTAGDPVARALVTAMAAAPSRRGGSRLPVYAAGAALLCLAIGVLSIWLYSGERGMERRHADAHSLLGPDRDRRDPICFFVPGYKPIWCARCCRSKHCCIRHGTICIS